MDGRHQRAERTRAAILDASLMLIGRDGLAELTQRRVAAQAGTSLASVTYHFASLDDLTLAAMQEASARVAERVGRLRERVDEGDDPLGVVAAALVELTDPASPTGVMLEATIAARRRPALRPGLDQAQAGLESLFAAFVDDKETARAMARAFQGLALWAISRGEDVDVPGVVAALVRTCAAFGVRPTAQSATPA